MPNLTLNFRPETLGAGTPVSIYLPDEITDDMPVLYLLHGMHGDHMSWLNGSAIGRYARALKIAVIMPSVGNSFYCNMKYGGRYHDYVAIELPEYIGKLLPFITKKREKTFIAGLSMGGYGAVKLALRNPDKFSACASLSGALDMNVDVKAGEPGWHTIVTSIWGEDYETALPGSEDDVIHLLKAFPEDKPKPRIYAACGTSDFLYQQNQTFRRAIADTKFEFKYEEGPGAHTWAFWDKWIVPALKFLTEEINK